MKNKALRPIIITAVVLALTVGAYFLLTLIPEAGEEEVSPSPSASKSSETYILYNEDYYSLKRMEFRFRDGTELFIDIDDSKNTRIFNLRPAKPGWSYKQDTLRSTAFNINSVTAIAKVAENVTDFSEYELDNPQLIARAVFKGENGDFSREIHIGKLTSLEDSYYARMKDDDTVYAISNYIAHNLMRTEMQYREMSFFPSYFKEDTLEVDADESITYIRIRNPETDVDIEISARSDEELRVLPVGTSKFFMTIPVNHECNDMAVADKFINRAAALNVTKVVEDDPEDLSIYGLDEPLELWMTNDDGKSVHYLIGSNEGPVAYVMVEGANSVLTAEGFEPDLRNLNHVTLMFKLAWIHNIEDVKSIVYDLQGEKRLYEIRENKKDENNKVISFVATLDGRPLSEENARRLYSRTHDMLIVGETSEEFDRQGMTPQYTITINMLDGTKNVMELYRLNERQYAVSVNEGELNYYINASDVKELLEGFEYIDRNEEMPR
jgi:hypothetical protein